MPNSRTSALSQAFSWQPSAIEEVEKNLPSSLGLLPPPKPEAPVHSNWNTMWLLKNQLSPFSGGGVGRRTFWKMFWQRCRHLLCENTPQARPFLTFAWQSSPTRAVGPWGRQSSGHHLTQTHKTPVIGKGHRLLMGIAKVHDSVKSNKDMSLCHLLD